MDPISIGGAVAGLIGGIGSLFGAGKANKQLERLLQSNPRYTANPIADQRLGFARALLNSKMPGSVAIDQNILGNQSNAVGNINRNATDSSTALALQGGLQGQTNQGLINAGLAENQNFMQRAQFLQGAEEGAIHEGDKVFQDQVRNFEDTAKIKGAEIQNRQGAWNSITNFGLAALNYGQFSNMFGNSPLVKKKTNTPTSPGGGGMDGRTPSEYRGFY